MDLISYFLFILILLEQTLFLSVYDESGIKGKSSGAEDLTSIPCAVPQSCSVWPSVCCVAYIVASHELRWYAEVNTVACWGGEIECSLKVVE